MVKISITVFCSFLCRALAVYLLKCYGNGEAVGLLTIIWTTYGDRNFGVLFRAGVGRLLPRLIGACSQRRQYIYVSTWVSGLYCKWLIEGEQGTRLSLRFLNVDIKPLLEDCRYDGLVVYDGGSTTDHMYGMSGVRRRDLGIVIVVINLRLQSNILLLSGRSCLIVGHHHLADDFLPSTAVFGSPYGVRTVILSYL